jgi:hypothetical protein
VVDLLSVINAAPSDQCTIDFAPVNSAVGPATKPTN